MSCPNKFIVSGLQKDYLVKFDSLGKYLFECLKKRRPDEIFGVDVSLDETVTCGSLLERSIKLSMALKEMSITSEDVVALVCENTLDSFVCILALMFLAVPVNLINSSYTARELKHVFSVSHPKCVICAQKSLDDVLKIKKECFIDTVILIDKLESCSKEIIDVKSLIEAVTKNVEDFQPSATTIKNTVVICVSSGTTGLPKCVELTNETFLYIIDYILDEDRVNATSTDVTVTVVPIAHIYGLIIYLAAIAASMKVVAIKSFKPHSYLASIQKYKATKLFIVPPLLHFLATNQNVQNFDISSIKNILVGAAPIPQVLHNEVLKNLRAITVRQLYGSTELGSMCSLQTVSDKTINSGALMCNLLLKVIDQETKESLPAYKIGELCFKGPNCMKGYLNNPTETTKAFDADGFYLTGDLGYYNENKNIFICGRLKELIKYKAFQVSPVEVENVLFEHVAVADCAVFGRPDNGVGELVTALVVLHDGMYVCDDDILKFVAERLSSQKHLHGGVVFVKEIPRNVTGKIIRRQLSKLFDSTIG